MLFHVEDSPECVFLLSWNLGLCLNQNCLVQAYTLEALSAN